MGGGGTLRDATFGEAATEAVAEFEAMVATEFSLLRPRLRNTSFSRLSASILL